MASPTPDYWARRLDPGRELVRCTECETLVRPGDPEQTWTCPGCGTHYCSCCGFAGTSCPACAPVCGPEPNQVEPEPCCLRRFRWRRLALTIVTIGALVALAIL